MMVADGRAVGRMMDKADDGSAQQKKGMGIAGLNSDDFVEWVTRKIERPIKKGIADPIIRTGLVQSFLNWAKRNSTWPLHWGIMCCAIEMAATSDPRYDVERLGVIYRSSPRQVDVLLLNGPISHKLRPMARRLYEQVPDPKWVIAMGECTICGGPYYDSYAVVKGAYTVMPVDVFIPGCPVRPEALMYGFLKLNQKIKAEKAGYVTTRKGRKVSSREGRMADFTGKYTHEVPEDRR